MFTNINPGGHACTLHDKKDKRCACKPSCLNVDFFSRIILSPFPQVYNISCHTPPTTHVALG